MTDSRQDLIKYRLEKAFETLESAEILVKEDKLFSAVNRIYYSLLIPE